jgi:hypothetical protein
MLTTFGRRKSQRRSGLIKGATKPPEAASTENLVSIEGFRDHHAQHTVDRAIDILLYEKVIDGLDILVLAGVSGTQDDADTDGVLVDELDCFLRVYNIAVRGAVDILCYGKASAFVSLT